MNSAIIDAKTSLSRSFPAISSSASSKKTKVTSTVSDFFRRAIHTASFGKLCHARLNKADVTAIRDFKKRQILSFSKIENSQDIPSSIKEERNFNESTQGMRNFAREMVILTVQRIKHKFIDPQITEFSKFSSDIPQILKNLTKEVIALGVTSAEPIVEIFSKFNIDAKIQNHIDVDRTLKWALKDILPLEATEQMVFKKNFEQQLLEKILISHEFETTIHIHEKVNAESLKKECYKKLLDWMYGNEKKTDQENTLILNKELKISHGNLSIIKKLFKDAPNKPKDELLIEVFESIKRIRLYSNNALEWLFHSDHSVAAKDLYSKVQDKPNDKLITQIFQSAVQVLAEKKIDYYQSKAHDILNNVSTIETIIRNNALIISDTLTARLGAILEDMGDEQFTVLFDKIIEVLGTHVTNVTASYEEADKVEQEHLALKEHAEEILKNTPKGSDVHKKCESYLNNLAQKGGVRGLSEDILLRTFLAKSGNMLPSIENSVTDTISDIILKSLFPQTIEDGKVISGLEALITKIEIPSQIKAIINEADEILSNITTENTYKELRELSKNVKESTKEFGLMCASELVKLGLSESIELVIKEMSKPEELNLLITESVLPSATELMIKFFGHDLIAANLSKLAPLFHQLPNEEYETKIAKELTVIAQRESNQYTIDTDERKREFQRIILPSINEVSCLLVELRQDPSLNTLNKTQQILEEYYSYKDDSINLIKNHFDELKFLFHKLPDRRVEENLLTKLIEIAKGYPSINLDTPEKIQIYRNSLRLKINNIALIISAEKKQKPQQYSIKSTENAVKNYIKVSSAKKDDNPFFANFIDAALATGEFGTIIPHLFNISSIRNSASQFITASIKNLRTSLIPNLNLALPTLRSIFLSSEKIDKLIAFNPDIETLKNEIKELEKTIEDLKKKTISESNPSERKDLEEKLQKLAPLVAKKIEKRDIIVLENTQHQSNLERAKENFPEEIDKACRIGYDVLMFKASNKLPILGKFILRRIIGPTADKIKRTALTLFNQIIGRHAFNQHLFSKISIVFLKGLHTAANEQSSSLPLTQTKNKQMLSDLIVPVSANSLKKDPFHIDFDIPHENQPLWQRIVKFVINKIKSFFSLFKGKPKTLNAKQVTLMTTLQNDSPKIKTPSSKSSQPASSPSADPLLVASKAPMVINPENSKIDTIKVETLPLNNSLKKAGDFVTVFMQKVSKQVYQYKVKPIKKFIKQHASSIPLYVQYVLDFATKISEPTTNSIIKILLEKGYRFQLDETTQAFLATLFKELRDVDNVTLPKSIDDATSLLTKIKNRDLTVLKDHEFKYYLDPILNWLKQSYNDKNEIRSLEVYIGKHKETVPHYEYNDQIISKLYIALIHWLVRFKIENHVKGFQTSLETNFTNLIKTHLDNNLVHISKLLFNRIAELLNQISDEDYKKMFDRCAMHINDQIFNITKAGKAVKDRSKIKEELASDKLEKDDKPLYRVRQIDKDLLTSTTNKSAVENSIFAPLVERLMNLILPKQQQNVDGIVKDVDAFQELWDNIIIEKSVKDTIEETRQFIKSLLPAKTAVKFDEIENSVRKQIEKFAVNVIKSYATKSIKETLITSFKMISDTNKRHELLANNFPALQKLLFNKLADLIMTKEYNSDEFFQMAIAYQTNREVKKEFIKTLMDIFKSKFQYSWGKLNISPDKLEEDYLLDISHSIVKNTLKKHLLDKNFVKNHPDLRILIGNPKNEKALESIKMALISKISNNSWLSGDSILIDSFMTYLNPILESISMELNETHKVNDAKDIVFDDITIKNELDKYFNGSKAEDKETTYFDIFINIIKMGNLNGAIKQFIEKASSFKYTEFINSNILLSLEPIRGSMRGMIDVVISGSREKFLDDKFIESIVNPITLDTLKSSLEATNGNIKELTTIKLRLDPTDLQVGVLNARIKELEKEIIETKKQIEDKTKELNKEPERLLTVQSKFNDGLNSTSLLAYDIINYSTNSLISFGFRTALDTEQFQETMQDFYTKFFEVEALNVTLPIKIMEELMTTLENALRQKTVFLQSDT